MTISRRDVTAGMIGLTTLGACARERPAERPPMYGLIGKMTAAPGARDELIAILFDGTGEMPGCLSYVVAKDSTDADGIWITEVWDSAENHKASLNLPSVKDAMARGRPLIAGFGPHYETTPIGGVGL